jgi:hypothetical protein
MDRLDDSLPKVLLTIFHNIYDKIHFIECQERAEQAGAIQAILFVDLPVAGEAGRLRFVTNGRKVGEGVGAGTGIVCYDDGLFWRRSSDDSTVAV